MSRVLAVLLDYNRPFATFDEARTAIAGRDGGGHLNSVYDALTVGAAAKVVISEYPSLFYLKSVLPEVRHVFDLGGFIGARFYCYSRYLHFDENVTWTVYDLPETLRRGQEIAISKNETRLRFSGRLEDAGQADLLLACGSLHYFEQSLPDMISSLCNKPRYVLINRTPLNEGPPVVTVQEGPSYLLPCILHSRPGLIEKFKAIGYTLLDEWKAPEGALIIPGYPDRSAQAYSGMFFRLAGTSENARTAQA